jgi:hypothetical protein
LGLALPFYLGYKKDHREKRILQLENRKMELAEIDSQETAEKTKLLLETRQMQVEEMKLKLTLLEEQLAKSAKRLIVP